MFKSVAFVLACLAAIVVVGSIKPEGAKCPACGEQAAHRPWNQQPHFECAKCGQRFNPGAVTAGATFGE